MEETGAEVRSVFDILRERMGMPPIEYVTESPQESNSWSRQMVAALRGHWRSISSPSFGGAKLIHQRTTKNDMGKLQMILKMLLLFVIAPVALHAQLPTKRVLTLQLPKKIAAAAETEALRRGATVVKVGAAALAVAIQGESK